MMHRSLVMFWILFAATSAVVAVPLYNMQKRQSDQRIAELETLLSLHKYGVGRRVGGRNSAGYGLIDFNYIGRKKKSHKEEDDLPIFRNSEDEDLSDAISTRPNNVNLNKVSMPLPPAWTAPKTSFMIPAMKVSQAQGKSGNYSHHRMY